MKFASATNLDRNSGVAKWRDLLCAFPPNQGPTSELANSARAILFIGEPTCLWQVKDGVNAESLLFKNLSSEFVVGPD